MCRSRTTSATRVGRRWPRCCCRWAGRTASTSRGCAGWSGRSTATWARTPVRTPARRSAPSRVVGCRSPSPVRRAGRGCWTGCGSSSGSPRRCAGGSAAAGSAPVAGGGAQPGLPRARRELLGSRRFGTEVERVAFALVANRALAPSSKLAAAEWITHDVAIPGLAEATDDQAYRAMDLLIEADTDAKIQEAVFFAVANLLNLEVDLLFFDTTSIYFERDTEDPPAAGGEAAGF